MKKTIAKILGLVMVASACMSIISVDVKAGECEEHSYVWERESSTGGDTFLYDDPHVQKCSVCGYENKRHSPRDLDSQHPDWYTHVISGWRVKNTACGVDGCTIVPSGVGITDCNHEWVYGGKRNGEKMYECRKCQKKRWEEDKKEKSSSSSSSSDAPFGGREASSLSVAEQKTAVAYAINELRASGNALPANTVTSSSSGSKSDIAAVVADNRDTANQQIYAQVACANLGFKNIAPLATYNMYSLKASYLDKNKAQVITWANTGLKPGDTAFVVWYNQILGKIDLLPAVIGPTGDVAVSVPALGDVSTMTVVKASK